MKLTKEEFRKLILKEQLERHKRHERDVNCFIYGSVGKTRRVARRSKVASQNPN